MIWSSKSSRESTAQLLHITPSKQAVATVSATVISSERSCLSQRIGSSLAMAPFPTKSWLRSGLEPTTLRLTVGSAGFRASGGFKPRRIYTSRGKMATHNHKTIHPEVSLENFSEG